MVEPSVRFSFSESSYSSYFQVAFWINREGIPGRACLSITTVLSLITLIGSTNSKLPNVSAVKALDVYFFICFGYVFGGLLEFATVIYLGRYAFKTIYPREKGATYELYSSLRLAAFVPLLKN